MIGDIMQPTHLLFVLVIALLVLGPKRLPEVGRQLGKGLRDFRAAINGEHTEHDDQAGVDQSHLSETYQASPEPVEHEFAHEPTESVSGPDQPGDGAAAASADNGHGLGDHPAEPTAEDHQFGHEAPVDVTPSAAEPVAADEQSSTEPTGDQAESDRTGSAGEHEFAYQPTRPADKPADPLP